MRPSLPHGLHLVALALVIALPSLAGATSQWSRKYGVACTTCHSPAFPRLNYHGEQFMRNGYQDVGTEDGDTTGKKPVGKRTFLEQLGNFLGVRLNVIPLRVVTHDLQTGLGEPKTAIDLGNANWLQLFTAGSLFKNYSFFIETEIDFEGEVHNSWFRLGAHNLFGTPLLNGWAGVMDPLELHSTAGRLPMIPPVSQEAFLLSSSAGKGQESLNLREGRPALALYGWRSGLVYEVGIDNGPNLRDTNQDKNVWGTLRGELTGGALEGSSVSFFAYRGLDSLDELDSAERVVAQAKNVFWRLSPAANLRWKGLDVLGGYVWGQDDNWTLAGRGLPRRLEHFQALFLQAGYPLFADAAHVAAQFDRVFSKGLPELELQKAALALSWLPRQNFRVMAIGRLDLLPIGTDHPWRKHELLLAIRTML